MAARGEARVLKTNVKRTVRLEPDGGPDGRHVVKRFHAPEAADRLRDRFRARREFRALRRLEARGLPVPSPIEVRKREGHWELVTEYVPATVLLRDVLTGDAPAPVALGRLARDFGRLLASLYEHRVHHADLHPGNVLVGPRGELWLVDFASSKARRRIAPGLVLRDLARLDADVRERTRPATRARFLAAFLAALPEGLRSRLPERDGLTRRVEDDGRALRRAQQKKRRLRWTRESSAASPFESGALHGFLAKDLDPALPARLDAEIAHAAASRLAGSRQPHFRIPIPGRPDEVVVGYAGWPWAKLSKAWYAAARLAGHELPCARPACIVRAPRGWAAFRVPAGARPLSQVAPNLKNRDRRRLLRSVADLLGGLHDRGLALPHLDPADLQVNNELEASFAIGLEPQDLAEGERREQWRSLRRFTGQLSRRERALFVRVYTNAHRHSRAESRSLAEELRHG